MRNNKFFSLLVFWLLLLLPYEATFAREKWKLTTLDWPPFTDSRLVDGGIGIKVLKEALLEEGIDLVVEFYPWTRAIETAKQASYIGYYPAWKEDIINNFNLSKEVFSSPVGFAENINNPLSWKTLEDLKGKTIGVVQNYGNNALFNELVSKGIIKTEIAQQDLINIRKVGSARIDGAFIDLNNLNYVLKNEARDLASSVRANQRVLEVKGLHIAINQNFANKKADEIIKRAIVRYKTKVRVEHFLQISQKKISSRSPPY